MSVTNKGAVCHVGDNETDRNMPHQRPDRLLAPASRTFSGCPECPAHLSAHQWCAERCTLCGDTAAGGGAGPIAAEPEGVTRWGADRRSVAGFRKNQERFQQMNVKENIQRGQCRAGGRFHNRISWPELAAPG
eukprot:scaffold3852_cov402-Prasinococcus_capsulatus_cf.AAC.1